MKTSQTKAGVVVRPLLVDRAIELSKSGLSIALVKATMLLEGVPQKDINAAVKEADISRVTRGFREEYYAYIVEHSPTMKQAEAFILGKNKEYGDTSPNIKAKVKVHLLVAEMSIAIRKAK